MHSLASHNRSNPVTWLLVHIFNVQVWVGAWKNCFGQGSLAWVLSELQDIK